MKRLVVIGGGEISQRSTFGIDKHIVELTKKQTPKALFIPTASGDSEDYFEEFKATYVDKLGCEAEALRLITEKPSIREIEQMVMSSVCWFQSGVRFVKNMNENQPCFEQIKGFGLINAFFCPHLNQRERANQYLTMMNDYYGVGIGLEDNCAIEFFDTHYRVIASQDDAAAYKFVKGDGVIKKEEIPKSEEYSAVEGLLSYK